jgi:hypothetical protein
LCCWFVTLLLRAFAVGYPRDLLFVQRLLWNDMMTSNDPGAYEQPLGNFEKSLLKATTAGYL